MKKNTPIEPKTTLRQDEAKRMDILAAMSSWLVLRDMGPMTIGVSVGSDEFDKAVAQKLEWLNEIEKYNQSEFASLMFQWFDDWKAGKIINVTAVPVGIPKEILKQKNAAIRLRAEVGRTRAASGLVAKRVGSKSSQKSVDSQPTDDTSGQLEIQHENGFAKFKSGLKKFGGGMASVLDTFAGVDRIIDIKDESGEVRHKLDTSKYHKDDEYRSKMQSEERRIANIDYHERSKEEQELIKELRKLRSAHEAELDYIRNPEKRMSKDAQNMYAISKAMVSGITSLFTKKDKKVGEESNNEKSNDAAIEQDKEESAKTFDLNVERNEKLDKINDNLEKLTTKLGESLNTSDDDTSGGSPSVDVDIDLDRRRGGNSRQRRYEKRRNKNKPITREPQKPITTPSKSAEKGIEKGTAKTLGKAGGKALGKLIPGVGLAIGAGFAYDALKRDDYLGALLEAGSGVASIVPGIGTAVSAGLTAIQTGRELFADNEEPTSDTLELDENDNILEPEKRDTTTVLELKEDEVQEKAEERQANKAAVAAQNIISNAPTTVNQPIIGGGGNSNKIAFSIPENKDTLFRQHLLNNVSKPV